MKRILLVALWFSAVPDIPAAEQPKSDPPLSIQVVIDKGKEVRVIPRGVFGVNLENIWNANGAWNPWKQVPNEEVLGLAKDLNTSLFRFPGVGALCLGAHFMVHRASSESNKPMDNRKDAADAASGTAGGGATGSRVSLVYFADLHAQLEEHDELFWSGGRDELVRAGGVARIAAAVQKIRSEAPGQVLFLDAGDTIQGSAPAAWSEGAAVVPAMNALGLDLGLPGNWEVVYGAAALKRRSGELKYPLIAANIFDGTTGQRLYEPYRVQEVNGVRIGILGYTDPDVPTRQPPSYSAGLRYAGYEVLPPHIEELRNKQRVDVVVLVTHVGLPKAVNMAENLRNVDFVFSADTHERTYEPIVRGDTWVVEPGAFGSLIGRLDFELRDGRVVNRRWELIELRADTYPQDAEVKTIVDNSLAPYRERMNRVIGRTEVPLMRYDVIHTSLDALLADALREATGTDIALSNGFRFAPPKAPGDITEADLWNWLPINTPVKVGNVTGGQLREFWEKELENVFSKDPKKLFGGWLPRPSGMTMRFAADALSGKRIRDLRIGGVPVEDNKSYTIASCEREGDADDTLCRIPHVANPRTLEFDAHAAVKKFLAKHSPIRSTEAPRVVCEDRPPVLRSQFLSATEASPPQPGPKAVKAVVHINFADTTRQGQGLKNVQNILKEVKGSAAIEVVVHAAGIPLLVKDNSAHAEQIQDLIKQGVRFVACENTMREKSISKEDLLPGVDTVPSGAVEVLRKQQDGYGYFRP